MINMYPNYNNVCKKLNKDKNQNRFKSKRSSQYLSLLDSALIDRDVIYSTYNEIKKLGKLIPLKYINMFNGNELNRLSICNKQVSEDDILGWVKCPSLLNLDEEIYVPINMLFMEYDNDSWGERHIPAFSTATASHKLFYNALENAIVKGIQLDAYTLTWYTQQKSKRVIIDDENVLSILKRHRFLGDECPFEIIPLYFAHDKLNLPNFAVVLRAKDKRAPYMFMTVQADLDPINGLLRGIMEAMPIAKSALYNLTYYSNTVNEVLVDNIQFIDLNRNLSHQIININQLIDECIEGEIKLSEIKSVHQQSPQKNVIYLLDELRKVSDYAIYLNITSPEAREKGYNVVKVLVPEILEMYIPKNSLDNHSRILQFGI